ncbi:hypothetical protein AAKU67_000308 [Oxalobacteraceae bacterium GrIS 2.11]
MKNHQATVSHWLSQLGQELNLPLSLGSDGHCIIPCQNELNCIVEVPANTQHQAVYIYLPLVVLPEQSESRYELLTKALQTNLFGLLTGGCHIALDERSNCIVLSFCSLIDGLDEIVFKHLLNDMLELAPALRTHLQAGNSHSKTVLQDSLQRMNRSTANLRSRTGSGTNQK